MRSLWQLLSRGPLSLASTHRLCAGLMDDITRVAFFKMLLALCEQFTLFYKGSACKSSANLDDIAVSKTPVYNQAKKKQKTWGRFMRLLNAG